MISDPKRRGAAVINALDYFKAGAEIGITWDTKSYPTKGPDSYEYFVKFPNPEPGTKKTLKYRGTLTITSPYAAKIQLQDMKGNANLPGTMYTEKQAYMVEYGKSYGIVANDGVNPQLDWNPDGQKFKVSILVSKSLVSSFRLQVARRFHMYPRLWPYGCA